MAFSVGDKVVVSGGRFPGVWTVSKVNSVNLGLVQEGGRKLRAHPGYCSPANGTTFAETLNSSRPQLRHVDAGEVVKLKGREGLYVVLADKGDRINVTKLGGDGGRYTRAPRSLIELREDFVSGLVYMNLR